MKTYTNEWMTASGNAAYLSGLILGFVKYGKNVSYKDKKFLLQQLMKVHETNNIGKTSEDTIKECGKLLEII